MSHPDPELSRLLRELVNRQRGRYGWRRSKLDEQQREYIIQREDVLKSVALIQRIDWQSIDCEDKEFALKLRENALHALACLARGMLANEPKIL